MRSFFTAPVILPMILLSVFVTSVRAQEETTEPTEATESSLKEKTIYVPYEKLSAVFEKEGRGIFLPYKEFLELWQRAQKKPPPPSEEPPPAEAVISGGHYQGGVDGDLAHLDARYRVEALKKEGWSVLKLKLGGLSVEAAEISPLGDGNAQAAEETLSQPPLFVANGDSYNLFLPRAGSYDLRLKLALGVESKPGQRQLRFRIPQAAVSTLELRIPEEEAEIEVSPQSAATEVTVEDGASHVRAFLGNATDIAVSWSPPVGEVQEEEALLQARQSVRATIGEGVLRLNSTVSLEILSQEVSRILLRIPQGLQVLDVEGENIRQWRLVEDGGTEESPEDRSLEIRLHSGVKNAYQFKLALERVLTETPEALTVAFPQVNGVLRETGYVALAVDKALRVRVVSADNLSQLDLDELPGKLGEEALVGFRYSTNPVGLRLAVEKILPVVHASSNSVLIFGPEEDLWIGWMDYRITRSGIFSLQLRVPNRWRVASFDDQKVEDYQSTPDEQSADFQILTVNLKSRASENFRLPFRFTAEGSAVEGENRVYAPQAVGVESDRGVLGIGGPRAFELTTSQRQRAVSTDVQDLFQSGILSLVPQEADASLAFKFSEQPAWVRVRLNARKTEIKVTSRLLVTVEENVVQGAQDLEYLVQYAAVDRLAFSAPEALDERLKVDVGGFKERRRVGVRDGRSIWEVALQRQVTGIVTVKVTFEEDLKGLAVGEEKEIEIPLIRAESLEGAEVRGETGAVAIRKEGSLEIQTSEEKLEGLEKIDPRELPPELTQGQIYQAFKFNQRDYRLRLGLVRHDYEKLADAMVSLLVVQSHLSKELLLTSVAVMEVQNAGLQNLDLRLPEGAKILSTVVDGRRVTPHRPPRSEEPGVEDTGGELFSVPLEGKEAAGGVYLVRVDYRVNLGDEMGSFGGLDLELPQVPGDVPIGKVELELRMPEDFVYVGRGGNLHGVTRGVYDPWGPVKRRLWGLLGVQREVPTAVAASPQREKTFLWGNPVAGAAIDLNRFREGKLFRLQGYSATAYVTFSFIEMRMFRVLCGILFAVSLVGGLFVAARRQKDRWWWIGGGSAVALLVAWLIADSTANLFLSIFFAGVLLMAGLALVLGSRRLRTIFESWRTERLRLAPDPYLEDAVVADKAIGEESDDTVKNEASPEESPAKETTKRTKKRAKKRSES